MSFLDRGSQVAAPVSNRNAAMLRGGQPATQEIDRPVARGTSEEDKAQFLDVRLLRQQYIDYLTTKADEIQEQQNARRYYHCDQWAVEQLRILRSRHQPPMTWNRIARKINGIVGLVERMRSDPKAMARSPKREGGAEIATQSIRYVLDANQFKTIDPWCLLQACIDGVAGVQMVLKPGDMGDPDVRLEWVVGDEYFYDPRNYRMNFEGRRYEGIAKWVDLEDAIELFPEKEDLLRGLMEGDSDMTTNADREYKWVMTASNRLRLVEHWYRRRGKWCWAFYVSTVLLEQGVSPFVDERGESTSPFTMFSAALDHDGDRYGFVRNLKGPQDTLNQGKSKTLHLANTKLVKADKGAVDDVEIARREVARPDGYLETNAGKSFEIVDTKQDLTTFIGFTEDAKTELDQYANTNVAALTGTQGIGNLSGRAIELLRQPGMAELGPFILSYRAWKLELYRKIWNAVQRHWTKERWLRINDNQGLAQFIQLNGVGLDQWGRPALVNAIGQVDVDISLEEGPDVGTLMQDAYDALKGYPPGAIPPQVLIEMNPNIPRSDKDRILQMMAPKPQPPNPVQQIATKLQLEGMAVRNAKTAAETHKTHAAAEQAYASAAEKRAKVGTEAARAGHLATQSHLDAAEFERDSILEAHRVERELNGPQQSAPPTPPQQGF